MSTASWTSLLDLGPMNVDQAVLVVDQLEALWAQQIFSQRLVRTDESLKADLKTQARKLRAWFDPAISGRRLRELIETAPRVDVEPEMLSRDFVLDVGSGRKLITLEGVAALHVLKDALAATPSDAPTVHISMNEIAEALASLNVVYREWAQSKLLATAALLREETATLRPTAAGLLFFLLLNRHTDKMRPLPRPKDRDRATAVTRAIAAPIFSFAQLVGGSTRASSAGFDVYRGWAYGEIARRLGSGFVEADGGVWISPNSVPTAVARLRTAFWYNQDLSSQAVAARVDLLNVATESYADSRPLLSAAGIAYERPSNTLELVSTLSAVDPPMQKGDS